MFLHSPLLTPHRPWCCKIWYQRPGPEHRHLQPWLALMTFMRLTLPNSTASSHNSRPSRTAFDTHDRRITHTEKFQNSEDDSDIPGDTPPFERCKPSGDGGSDGYWGHYNRRDDGELATGINLNPQSISSGGLFKSLH